MSNELHFGVYALVNIAEGEEITLPFDFKFDKWYNVIHAYIYIYQILAENATVG